MRRRHALALIVALIFSARPTEAQFPFGGSGSAYLALWQEVCRTLLPPLSGRSAERLETAFQFNPQADGGGDGGDGGGTGGGDDGDGDGSAGDAGDPGNNDAAAATDPSAPADPTSALTGPVD